MADFVAVIRRAVDGLTDNTPEMRARVYDKARGAVVRQLENMNPRPPEAMFKRQLDKLDDAIRMVEEEHGEALPAEPSLADPVLADPVPAEPVLAAPPSADTMPAAAVPIEEAPSQVDETFEAARSETDHAEAAPAPAQQVTEAQPFPTPYAPSVGEVFAAAQGQSETAYDALPVPEPRQHQPEPNEEIHHEPAEHAAHAAPVFVEPVSAEPVSAEPVFAEPPMVESEVAPPAVEYDEPARIVEPVVHASTPDQQDNVSVETVATTHVAEDHDDPLLSHLGESREPAIRHASNRVMEQPYVDSASEFPGDEQEPAPQASEPAYAERHVSAMPAWGVDIDREPEVAPEPAPQMPRAALTETDVATGFNEFLKSEFSTPGAKPPGARKEPEGDFSWDAPFDDLPDLPKPVAFEQALHDRQEELARAPVEASTEPQRDARSELEDLIGYKPAGNEASADAQGETLSPEVTRAMSKLEGKSFKVGGKPRQKFNPLPIAFGVGAALIVAGGAFAAYTYRDDVSALVASYIPSGTSPTETRAVEETAAADQTKSVAAGADDTAETQATAADDKPTEVASLDTNIVPTKFTQRLLEDGTEAETEAAKIPIDQSLTEGKTIAGATVAAETEVAANNPSPALTDQTAETPGLTVAQKMILYEERLGDSPVAVQGKVTWALKDDTTNTTGKSQPLVEATVEVPERKLKAVVTFKRNSDASLPASHIIEVVFDLPDDFAEGNVESVQRIAFKQTEQDRGNGLIAVPAKITDEFHMIALNDDADARKVNTDLMKTRSWIDIPVVYRNNRRALLTFEKGTTGTEAFEKALAEWAALGPTATSN